MARGLTRRQREILDFIVAFTHEQGMPPTIAEIGSELGITSTNGVADHLKALARKGYIERASNKARSILVTDHAMAAFYRSQDDGTLPMLGRVAAGAPIFAEENVQGRVAVPAPLASEGRYCLRVQGESMIEDGILDGDTIIVDTSLRAGRGDIVVALVENEVTVKRYFPRGNMVELRPANSAMQPILVPVNRVQIQGVVVALQRQIR